MPFNHDQIAATADRVARRLGIGSTSMDAIITIQSDLDSITDHAKEILNEKQ